MSVLFPVTDLRHPVCTPAFVLLTEYLTLCCVRSVRDVLAGVFLCHLALRCVSGSRRYVPEAVAFLSSVLVRCTAAGSEAAHEGARGALRPSQHGVPPSRQILPMLAAARCPLHVAAADLHRADATVVHGRIPLSRLLTAPAGDHVASELQLRVQLVCTTVRLLRDFAKLYSDCVPRKEVFALALSATEPLREDDGQRGPFGQLVEAFRQAVLSEGAAVLVPLQLHRRRAEPIKMFTPKFEAHFDVRTRRTVRTDRDVQEIQRLRHKARRELRGAMRELRKDSAFIAREQLKATLERDRERKERVKRLEHDLSMQQHEAKLAEAERRRRHKRHKG